MEQTIKINKASLKKYLLAHVDPKNGLEDSSGRTPIIVDEALDYLRTFLPLKLWCIIDNVYDVLDVIQEVHKENTHKEWVKLVRIEWY